MAVKYAILLDEKPFWGEWYGLPSLGDGVQTTSILNEAHTFDTEEEAREEIELFLSQGLKLTDGTPISHLYKERMVRIARLEGSPAYPKEQWDLEFIEEDYTRTIDELYDAVIEGCEAYHDMEYDINETGDIVTTTMHNPSPLCNCGEMFINTFTAGFTNDRDIKKTVFHPIRWMPEGYYQDEIAYYMDKIDAQLSEMQTRVDRPGFIILEGFQDSPEIIDAFLDDYESGRWSSGDYLILVINYVWD